MSTGAEPTHVLSIGMIVGGRTATNRPWVEAVQALMREVVTAREGVATDINVNVEFHVPGNFLSPEFEGVRTGTFRKADSLIKVQAALTATAPTDPRGALIGCLWEALDAVDAWTLMKRRACSTAALRVLVASLEAADGG